MLTSNTITAPAPQSTFSARPTIQDMVNAHITYIAYKPYDRADIHESGTVLQIRTYKNTMYMQVQPDNKRAPKWVSEFNFISYRR